MKTFIGAKLIAAEPQEKDGQDGYKVVYADGYTSWSPKAVFEEAYRSISDGAMTFGLAIESLKKGYKVARAGWNGKGMFLGLVAGYDYNPKAEDAMIGVLGCEKLHWIGMKTADNKFVPWLASQTDVLA